ncbi:uncharacterized protein LOC132255751 [Phlebotomus argentipes]|uniref:uncharacterized protein LOC132255751 n=1 Tax=Phlebotomus argentipes TaxID=94469 RepID=UPI0028934817|nr:uncharacterized protein LOC132255751 [Phlebotomus argentipes]
MVDISSIIEGTVKFRDGKKWKSRWCVMRKLSPVADCLHLQLYRDSKDRYKHGQTKASLSLQHFLGVESGFTLDKESNTIAIICQDVIVVLAFDTRERLIQWQVKISTNLGDDIQYLILVSTAPPKAKVSTGPARMHVQDHRFCLTTGVPPRLAGLWEIGHLRRYGVVDNRFCFEGGSQCGKGEGLYILVTDQGDEITHTLKVASQGKLATRRRPVARKLSALDSPRKLSPRPVEDGVSLSANHHFHADEGNCMCSSRTSFWPSQESRDLDSNYGCGDTVSVSEAHDGLGDGEMFRGRATMSQIERCMSCISKLGAPSMSRSSTAAGTPGLAPAPAWTIPEYHTPTAPAKGHDRMSLCSSHTGSSSNSEYSVPRSSVGGQEGCWGDKASPCAQCGPPRPPKPKSLQKPPMPLPLSSPAGAHAGPYENYDVPRTPIALDSDNYDTPKKIHEYLSADVNSNPSSASYANYDIPSTMGKMCGCLGQSDGSKPGDSTVARTDCTCTRVMSWADNWISLPYCRRGNTIENTGIPISRVKLSGEGKMPVMQPSGELAIYATVDMAKKMSRRIVEKCECIPDDASESGSSNYINLDPAKEVGYQPTDGNYTNMDFAQSLEHYENSKNVLERAGLCNETESSETVVPKVCHKCGHATGKVVGDQGAKTPSQEVKTPQDGKNENYVMMEPRKDQREFPGYLPMSPAAPQAITTPPIPTKSDLIKQRMNRIIGEKSASNPSLNGPSVDRTKKRSEDDTRVPGSAMMRTAVSPYTRKQLMDNSDLIPGNIDKRLVARKRSSSADSSRFLEEVEEFDSTETLRKSSLTQLEGRRSSSPCIHQESEQCEDTACCVKASTSTSSAGTEKAAIAEPEDDISGSTTQSQNSQSVYIRRSESVPCKAQNRDSSSSNDSGVSTGSLRQRTGDFVDFELPLTTAMSARRHQKHILPATSCVHASLPRRSKSFDPLRELTFQFQKIKIPEKSTSAEAEIPICPPKVKGFASPGEVVSTGPPYIDSRSTSSGTSDMSDYIETLSLSSHSSSDTPEGMRLIRPPTSTLRPRSGKEYQNIDRSILCLTQQGINAPGDPTKMTASQFRSLLPGSVNYANITPVPENAESPSPGYQSGSSPQENQTEHFMFKVSPTAAVEVNGSEAENKEDVTI